MGNVYLTKNILTTILNESAIDCGTELTNEFASIRNDMLYLRTNNLKTFSAGIEKFINNLEWFIIEFENVLSDKVIRELQLAISVAKEEKFLARGREIKLELAKLYAKKEKLSEKERERKLKFYKYLINKPFYDVEDKIVILNEEIESLESFLQDFGSDISIKLKSELINRLRAKAMEKRKLEKGHKQENIKLTTFLDEQNEEITMK